MRRYIALASAIVVVLSLLWVQHDRISALKVERDRYISNTRSMLAEAEIYKASDSLNAAKVSSLELTLGEYKDYRKQDLALISSLKLRAKDVNSVASLAQETSAKIETIIRDSIIYRDNNTTDTLRCIDCDDQWTSIHGCADVNGMFRGEISVRDSVIVVESIQYKRFLGFLWRTKKIKRRTLDVVSRNPHTRIIDVEHIYIH